MAMGPRLAIAAVAAACHLIVVAAGALGAEVRAGGALGAYVTLSGAASARGFFGKVIEPTPRPSFEVRTRDGAVRALSLAPSAGRDAEIRLASTLGARMAEDDEACRAIAARCAARILARHPEAEGVIVKLRADDLPTMAEAERGAAPRSRVLYEGLFSAREAEP